MLAKGDFELGTQVITLFPSGAAGGRVQQHADAPEFQGMVSQRSGKTSNRGTP
jgi:hypothetical protein